MTHTPYSTDADQDTGVGILTDETGADLVEWAILVALIAIVALVAVAAFGGEVAELFDTIADTVANT